MFNKRLKQENRELKAMVELLKKQNDEKREMINSLINAKSADIDVSCVDGFNTDFPSILKNMRSIPLKQTPVSDLQCSTRLRNILKGLIYTNEDQSFKSVFEIYSKRELQNTRNLGVKLFEELEELRVAAGINYKSNL